MGDFIHSTEPTVTKADRQGHTRRQKTNTSKTKCTTRIR